ncbi:hypothetical protein [Alicyclobacillus dauci]|uniref:YfhD-like protein n=1 Tax=Alicyclobacillus dauci TaxID=1475485 RepID=A0ABY6Z5F4_9BACL|nr:hypothetical protein [Alicyclobacillus dauci]WAH37551.1 hypothetical protein NZD86_03190 [Alicyclobacillus dauci]
MPKAENRKRPPNLIGNVPGRAKNNRPDGMGTSPEYQNAQNKRQDLLDKMRKLQAGKKTE